MRFRDYNTVIGDVHLLGASTITKLKYLPWAKILNLDGRRKDLNGLRVTQAMKKKGLATHKVMDAYTKAVNVGLHSLRFLFRGQTVDGESTSLSLGLKDGDVIEAFLLIDWYFQTHPLNHLLI